MTQIVVPEVSAEVSYSVVTSTTGPLVVPFPFFEEDDVKATVVDALGVVTPLVNTTDFTFTTLNTPVGQEGNGYESGEITLLSAIGADGNTTIRVYRDTVVARNANFPTTGPFKMPLLNDELNRFIMILQEYDNRLEDATDPADLAADEIVTGQWTLPENTIIRDLAGQNRRIAFRRNVGRYIVGSSSLLQTDDDSFVEYAGAGGDNFTLLDPAEAGTTVAVMNVGSGVLNIVEDTGSTLEWLNGSTILFGNRILSPGGVATLKYDSNLGPGTTSSIVKCWGLGLT